MQAENGCDSIVYLDLEVLPVYTISTEAQICEGDTYGEYTQTGTYFDVYQSENGCDSIVRLDLQVVPHVEHAFKASICDGDTYPFGDALLSESGTYYDTIASGSFVGCDSLITLQLAVIPPIEKFYDFAICEGDSIFIAGAFQTESGVFIENLVSVEGCDSLVENSLEVIPLTPIEGFGGEICLGDTVLIGVQGSDNYLWSPAEGLSCTNCPTPFASPKETTVYTISSTGCLGRVFETQVEVIVHQAPILEVFRRPNHSHWAICHS